jgi:hypothetical protein
MNEIPNTCKDCPHAVQYKRRLYTTHCTLDPFEMDVTLHTTSRSLFCPLVNKQITEEIPIEE